MKRTAGFAVLAGAAAVLLGLNFHGSSPLKTAVLACLKPALSLASAADSPMPGDEDGQDAEVKLLRAKNARLALEVTQLRRMLEAVSGSKFDGKRYPFRGVPARVISGLGDGTPRKVILVDRGTIDGISPGMGVVAGDMVVGRVFRAGEELSLVMLLTDPGCRVRCSVLIGDGTGDGGAALSEIEGLSQGEAESGTELVLRHLPYHARVLEGQDVVTSGKCGAFPAGMVVGNVSRVSDGYDLFLDARARPGIAGEKIDNVLILVPCLPSGEKSGERAGPTVQSGR